MYLCRIICVLLALAAAAPTPAETRVALVIGNAAYKHAPALANPKNDAEGVAASLRRLKFEVLEGTDLDKPAMERLLQAFSLKLEAADVALIFYAGHGLQVHGRNYLVPIEAKLDREADLVFQAVPLDVIQGLMEQSQRTNIMILDACRDNPLARNLARTMGTRSTSIGRGLGEAKAGIGTLIVYATQPGNVALDGDTKNSPFTAALLKHIEAPGLEIRQVLTRVRNDVITATRDKQVPWDSSSLRGDFFFASAPGAVTPPPAVTPTVPPPSADQETVFWQSIKDSNSAADFKDYLARWPSGTFAELAKRRIAEIEKAADVTPPKPKNSEPPQKPAPPQRISSFLPNTVIHRARAQFIRGIKTQTPQQCRAMCLGESRCVGWDHYTINYSPSQQDPAHLECRLYSFVEKTDHNSLYHAGVIRTTPAAAPGAPITGDPLKELIRRANARAREDGICARLPKSAVVTNAVYDSPPGTQVRFRFVHENLGREVCGLLNIGATGTDAGRRSVADQQWICHVGAHCQFERRKWCKVESGGYGPC